MDKMITAKGVESTTLTLKDDSLQITRSGILNMGPNRMRGTVTIPLGNIQSVEYTTAKYSFSRGRIHFIISGSKQLGVSKLIGAKYHPHTIFFDKRHESEFKEILEYVESYIIGTNEKTN